MIFMMEAAARASVEGEGRFGEGRKRAPLSELCSPSFVDVSGCFEKEMGNIALSSDRHSKQFYRDGKKGM